MQNVVGLAVFAIASFGIQILVGRKLGPGVFGIVNVGQQLAFITAAATRFGMDMASTRRVAVEVGQGTPGPIHAVVRRASLIALAVSVGVGALIVAAAGTLGARWDTPSTVIVAAGVSVPFIALTFVLTAASRGLKLMKPTLYAYWIGQSVSWVVFAVLAWQVAATAGATVYAYAASWIFAAVIAAALWIRAAKRAAPAPEPLPAGETQALLRYGAPRAPAALFSQALFWVDFFVLSAAAYVTADERGVYAASVRLSQTLVLFLTAVSYMFSPYVADLYERGEIAKLNGLFKTVTRWTFALTLPLLGVLLVVPGSALKLFGAEFTSGTTALRILLIGQIVNVSVGAAGFVLIMVKRTGWDLIVYATSFAIDLSLCLYLIDALRMGSTGAAIAQTITIAFSNGLRIFLVWKFVGIHPYNRYYFRLAIPFSVSLVAMIGAASLCDQAGWLLQLVITGVLGTAVFAGVMLATAMTPMERTQIAKVLAKFRARGGGSAAAPG